MSVSPTPSGATPTLAEILMRRAFTRPAKTLVDGDVIRALSEADRERAAQAAPPKAPAVPARAAVAAAAPAARAALAARAGTPPVPAAELPGAVRVDVRA
ncbi:hypothetical protein FSW04_08920 [Baekduia soli]|uniref:Uncharacterized protein n=1 Tax=Baekduia soli TaxID=496014 RepID=A0A5B8U3Q3_9ACTN|nr:hypothetical protein [Baekduia soli]QEC47684.1 hypothetical protein FSW04_08920 [Baekduia soli]